MATSTKQVSITFTADSLDDVMNDVIQWALLQVHRAQQASMEADQAAGVRPADPVPPVAGLLSNAPPSAPAAPAAAPAARTRRTRGPGSSPVAEAPSTPPSATSSPASSAAPAPSAPPATSSVGAPTPPTVGISPPKPLTAQGAAVQETVKAEAKAFAAKHGVEYVRQLLSSFNVTRIAELKPEDGLFFVARLKEQAELLAAPKEDVRALVVGDSEDEL